MGNSERDCQQPFILILDHLGYVNQDKNTKGCLHGVIRTIGSNKKIVGGEGEREKIEDQLDQQEGTI